MKLLIHVLLFLAALQLPAAAASPCATGIPVPAACDCGTGTGNCQPGQVCDAVANTCSAAPAQPSGDAPQSDGKQAAPKGPSRCQNKDGTLLPSATICEDKLDKATCDAVFPAAAADPSADGAGNGGSANGGGTASGNGASTGGGTAPDSGGTQRPANCDVPDLADMALKCAKTCKICCETAEYGCEDDAAFGIDCQTQKSKCKMQQWTAAMSQACPQTCGLCNFGSCRDAIAGCSSLKTLCRDFTHRTYMARNCARTCQLCPQTSGAVSCEDVGINCASFPTWCTDSAADHQKVMRESCKKTCGFC